MTDIGAVPAWLGDLPPFPKRRRDGSRLCPGFQKKISFSIRVLN